jgi:hypothetical protein
METIAIPILDRKKMVGLSGGLLLTAAASISFPLAVYSIGIACFGLTHVLTELRYVNQRFSARLVPWLRLVFGLLLMAVVGTRCLAIGNALTAEAGLSIELGLVALLILCVSPNLWTRGWPGRLAAMGSLAFLIIGTWYAPLPTILIFAMLHNLTPIGFLFERLQGLQRQQAMVICLGAFVVIPLLIMSGWPDRWLSSLGIVFRDTNFFQLPDLFSQLGAYVPPVVQKQTWATHYFCAAVYLQCLHYVVVIGLLPRLGGGSAMKSSAWLTTRQFNWLLIGLSTLLWVWFTKSFLDARRFYGLIAAIHAWLEIPILLLVLAGTSAEPVENNHADAIGSNISY